MNIYAIVTDEFEPKFLRGSRFGNHNIKTYEKLGHARGALTQMQNMGRRDAQNAIIVEVPVHKGKVCD